MLSESQLETFRNDGHLTLPRVFPSDAIDVVLQDLETWSGEFLDSLDPDQRRWYLERGEGEAQLRKLDNPVYHRPAFRSLAGDPRLLPLVEQIIGKGVRIFFSQVFMKPPEIGGPKPIHQDNYYFGPDQPDAMLTVWIALDDATLENGCLYYGDGSHRFEVFSHTAPADEPFNLQATAGAIEQFPMSPAPVPRGGVSFHHGNTLHQSSNNTSSRWRRAAALHYLQNEAALTKPALKFDESYWVAIS